MTEFEDYSEELAHLSIMMDLWGYTQRSRPIQSYLKLKGAASFAHLNRAQINALALILEASWQKQSEAFRIEMMRLAEWLRVLGLTTESPQITAWLRRQNVTSDDIPLGLLQALNAILKGEFERLQVAKIEQWERREYGFSLTR